MTQELVRAVVEALRVPGSLTLDLVELNAARRGFAETKQFGEWVLETMMKKAQEG
jgi:hypothetical protein